MSEIDFAFCYKGTAKIIAITGTNGKSTTTSLLHHIFQTASCDAALVGNIGYSFAKQIAEKPHALYVLEVSSFQLDDIHFFRPDVAILLNITADHLNRYDNNFEKYIQAKFAITKFQNSSDFFIYNQDDKNITNHFFFFNRLSQTLAFTMNTRLTKGAYTEAEHLFVSTATDNFDADLHSLPLRGKHNAYNMMAGSLAAKVMNIKNEMVRESLQTFKGLAHRMETVASIRGVEYMNDSKATNINSTWYALESMTKPVVLILGGQDKGNDYATIEALVRKKVKAIICLGINNKNIIEFFKDIIPVHDLHSLTEVLAKAYEISKKGDIVLLSPACASFDLFKNFEDRGEQFREQVMHL